MSNKKTFKQKFKTNLKKFFSTQTKAKVAALSLAFFALISAATIGGGELYKGYFQQPIDRATVDEIRRTLDENQQRQTVTPDSLSINPPEVIFPDGHINLDFNLDDLVPIPSQISFSNFRLTTPVNQSTNQPLRPTFRWENLPTNLPSNTRMFINLATSNNFPVHSTRVFQVTNINQPFTLPNNLTPNTTYYWFVQFNINGELRSINIINSFRTTDTTESAVLLTPTNLDSNVSTNPTFTWQPVTNSKEYRLQIEQDRNYYRNFAF